MTASTRSFCGPFVVAAVVSVSLHASVSAYARSSLPSLRACWPALASTWRTWSTGFERLPSPFANMKVIQQGGEVTRLASEPNAVAHRDARFLIVIASAWDDRAQDQENIAWVQKTWSLVHQHSRRGGSINFLTADADADEWAAARSGVDLERLAAIRRHFDPDGIFRSSSR